MENAKLTDFIDGGTSPQVNKRGIPSEELICELHRLRDELGEVPSIPDMEDRGHYSPTAYRNAFGTWTDGLLEAGFTKEEIKQRTCNRRGRSTRIPNEDLLADLEKVADTVERVPRVRDVKQHGEYAHETYRNRFGSWDEVLELAGFEPDDRQFGIGVGELIDEMLRVAVKVDRPPYGRDMNEHGKYSEGPYKRTFGSWAESLAIAGLPRRERGGSLPIDVGSKFDTYGENWYDQRAKAMERDRYRCQDCGLTQEEHRDECGRGLDVHHIMPVRRFETPEEANILLNLITLCRSCHAKWEQMTPEAIKEGF